MEEFDDDDFSDLYADVEVQASSAISALHRSTELPPRSDRISANAARGEKKAADERGAVREEAEEEKGDGGGVGDLRNLSAENGDRCESRSASWSESESERECEDGLASDGEDGVERKVDENYEREKCDDRAIDVGFGTISGKDNSTNDGDYGSQRKCNSLNSKTKGVHEMAQQMRRTCRNGVADDGNPIFSRASEDNRRNNERKHGVSKITSERHKEASYPAPKDLDKRGSVQISDSFEDSPCEVSECDSDGTSETSDDTNRRKASCIPNKVSSALKPESFERGWSQRRQDYSRSVSHAALNSRYFKKSHEHSRHSSSSLHCDSEEPISQKHGPHKDTESCGVRQGTRDGRNRERWINSTHEHSNQPKRSSYMPYFKNRPDEDASYATDAKHLYNRHVNHGKQRETINLTYNEVDFPYCSHSERNLTYSDGRLPDHLLGPAFLKDQYWDPDCRYRAGHPDGRSMSGRQNFLNKKSSLMNYETLGYNRYHNQRRHHFQGDIEGVRNLSLKYSSAVGNQLVYKGEVVNLGRRTRQDYLSPLHDYDDGFVEEKYRILHPCSGGDRDHDRRIQPDRANCKYDRVIAHDRREVESFGRGKRRRHSTLSRENLCYIETEANDRRNIGHRPFPFYSSEEPYASGRGEFLGASGPKSGVAQRNMRCSWKEMHIECDQYGTDVATFVTRESLGYHPPEAFNVIRRDYQPSSNTNVTRESNKNNQYQDHFVGRRRHRHSEVLFPREDVHMSRQQNNIVFGSEELSHNFRKKSKNDKADDRPAFCHVTELNEREMGRQNSNILRDEDNSNHFDGSHKSTKLNAQTHLSHQDSVDRLVVVGRKCTLQSSIRRTTEAGEDTFYGRSDLVGSTDKKEPNNLTDSDECKPDKTVPSDEGKVDSNLSNRNQQNEFLDIEEGQIITEEMKNEDASQINASGQSETTSNDNAVVEKLDDEKIKEIMMKMERRRERFKEPIKMSMDGEKTSPLLLDTNVETAEARLERPARKRRWL